MPPQIQLRDNETGEAVLLQADPNGGLSLWNGNGSTRRRSVAAEGGQWFSNALPSTTTASAPRVVLSGRLAPVAGGAYVVQLGYRWNHNGSTSDFVARWAWDGAPMSGQLTDVIHRQEPKDTAGTLGGTGTDQVHPACHFWVVNLDPGDRPTFKLSHESSVAGVASSIWDIYLAVRPL